jgi:hypothetical protein
METTNTETPFERKTWFTAIIKVTHAGAHRFGGDLTREHVLGRFATTEETIAAIVAYAPKKGAVSYAYVCRCEQTGWWNGYGGAEVTGNYDLSFTPKQIADARARVAA